MSVNDLRQYVVGMLIMSSNIVSTIGLVDVW